MGLKAMGSATLAGWVGGAGQRSVHMLVSHWASITAGVTADALSA